MAFLYSNEDTVERLSGLCLKGTMLTTTQYHDRRHVMPFVLEKEGKSYFLVRQMDQGNIEGAGFKSMPQMRFLPYFLPDATADVPATAAQAVLAVLGKEPLTVDEDMPVTVYRELKTAADTTVQQSPSRTVDAFRLSAKQVLSKFNHHRPDVIRAANEMTAGHPQYKRLNALYALKGDPFAILDAKASVKGIGTAC